MSTTTPGVLPTAASSTSTAQKPYRDVLRQLYGELDVCRVKALEQEQDTLFAVIELVQGGKGRTAESSESLLLRLQHLLSDQHGQEANERIRAQIKAKFTQAARQFYRTVDEYIFYSKANALENISTHDRYTRDLTARPIHQSIEVDPSNEDDSGTPVQDEPVEQDYQPSRAPTPQVIETIETRNDSTRTEKRKRQSKAKAKAPNSAKERYRRADTASSLQALNKTRKNAYNSRRLKTPSLRKTRSRAAASAGKRTNKNMAADITTALTERTARFEDVFQNGSAAKKYQIAEFDGNFYYVSCDIHDESFLDKKDSFKSANGHLREHLSRMNKSVKKVCYETMLPHLGVHIVDCTREDAIRNNRVRQLAIAASKAHCAQYGAKAKPLSIQQVPKTLIDRYRVKELVPWTPYAAFLGQTLTAIAAVALPVDGPITYLQKLHDTITQPFLQKIPACILFLRETQKFGGWAPGYRDGEANVKDRLYPVLGFDVGPHLHNRTLEWVSLADDIITPFDEHNTGCQSKRNRMLQFIKDVAPEGMGNNDDANSSQSPTGSPVVDQSPTLTDPHVVDSDVQEEEAPRVSVPQLSTSAAATAATAANSARQNSDDYITNLSDIIGDSPAPTSYDYRDVPSAATDARADERARQSTTVESNNPASRLVTQKISNRRVNPQNAPASWITANRISPLQGRQPEAVMDAVLNSAPQMTEYELPSS